MKRYFLMAFFIGLSLTKAPIIYAQTISLPGNERVDYFTELLALTLSYHPEKNYTVGFFGHDVPKLRAFKFIENDEGIEVIPAGYTYKRSERLRPIPLPLLKGLNGWRIPLVTSERAQMFDGVETVSMFKRFQPGQMLNWSDSKILESNDIKVIKGISYAGLFSMLVKDRFDYFPRSVLEVEGEYEHHKNKGIVIEPNVIIHYPTAYVFYVRKDNKELAEDLKEGLESAYRDGSFDRLFNKYYGEKVDKITKQKRKKFALDNPFLPTDIPLSRQGVWLELASQSH